MFGTQFHPEKVMYEWTLKYPTIPHFANAVRANNWFAGKYIFFLDFEEMCVNLYVIILYN